MSGPVPFGPGLAPALRKWGTMFMVSIDGGTDMPLGIGRGSGVAVVEMHGIIGNQIRSNTYSRLFETIAGNKFYRALLLDIDSPGGSAATSEALYVSIRRVAEKKPVVAFVRGLGASGGYYLCCAASQVYALPTTLVGSIGVIYLRPVLEQLLGRVGVEFSIFKGGKYKDMTGFWRASTPEESERMQSLIDEIYDNFVNVVAEGRSLPVETVRELATGEIMTSQRAAEAGLVDHLGDYTDALNAAAEAGKTSPRAKLLQPRRSLSQKLMGRPSTEAEAMAGGFASLQRLMNGGIFYLDPAYLAGWPGGN